MGKGRRGDGDSSGRGGVKDFGEDARRGREGGGWERERDAVERRGVAVVADQVQRDMLVACAHRDGAS
eukprot:1759625-Rhodomonas_salina.2